MDMRRTLLAETAEGLTLIIRQFGRQGEPSTYEVSVYEGYLTASPEEVPLPAEFPESFTSLDQAMERVTQHWGLGASAFEDAHRGRSVVIDFVQALRQGDLSPIQLGMSSHDIVDLFGCPEHVMAMAQGMVCWFYGTVQMHLEDGVLRSLEIDNGKGDFTSIRLMGWFLDPSVTRTQLEQKLRLNAISYVQAPSGEGMVIRASAPRQGQGFIFDFHAKDERIHAFYWNRVY